MTPERNQSEIGRNGKKKSNKKIREENKLGSRKGKQIMLPNTEVFSPSKGTIELKSKQQLEVTPKPKRIKHRRVITEEV